MKKGQKPSRHVRRVRTKKGRRKVLVNRRVKKKVKRKNFGSGFYRVEGLNGLYSKSQAEQFRKTGYNVRLATKGELSVWDPEVVKSLRKNFGAFGVAEDFPLEKVLGWEEREKRVASDMERFGKLRDDTKDLLLSPILYGTRGEGERAYALAERYPGSLRVMDYAVIKSHPKSSPLVRERAGEAYALELLKNYGSLSIQEIDKALKGGLAWVGKDTEFTRFDGDEGTHTVFFSRGDAAKRLRKQFGLKDVSVGLVNKVEDGRPVQVAVFSKGVVTVHPKASDVIRPRETREDFLRSLEPAMDIVESEKLKRRKK